MTDNSMSDAGAITQYPVTRYRTGIVATTADTLAVEEPLEIRVCWQRDGVQHEEPLTITMRTPGHDLELAAGLLYSESIVRSRDHIARIAHGDSAGGDGSNTVVVDLAKGHQLDMKRYQRNFYSNSSCGVCGKMLIESLHLLHEPGLRESQPLVATKILSSLPAQMCEWQPLFAATGGVHAAALFSLSGELLLLREDIGRHNAVDKLLGARLLEDQRAMDDNILLVSGRAGFEIVQKALSANIAVLVAVGAPTSLAVDMARDAGMTLVGFLKPDSFNCYSGEQRLLQP